MKVESLTISVHLPAQGGIITISGPDERIGQVGHRSRVLNRSDVSMIMGSKAVSQFVRRLLEDPPVEDEMGD